MHDRRDSAGSRGPALFALTLSVFLVTLNITVVVVALPAIRADLDASRDAAAWVVDVYNLVGASFLLSLGFLGDRFGRRRVLRAGYVLFVAGAVGAALAPGIGWLVAFRVVQAVGGTTLTPTSLAIIANLYPEARERARAIGMWGIAGGLGTGLGPLVGGGFTAWLGWRWMFGVNALLGGLAVGAVLALVPRSRSPVPRRFDVPGQALAALLLAALTVALIEAPRFGWGSPQILVLAALAGIAAVAFVAVELRRGEPLVDLHFFRDAQFSGAIFITVGAYFAFAGFVYFSGLYLQQSRGESALVAGATLLPAALPSVVGGPVAGRLVAARGTRVVLAAGTAAMTASLALLAALPAGVAIRWLLLVYLLLGLGWGVISAPINAVAVASMPGAQAGIAAAIASVARNVGILLGIAVLGSIARGHLAASVGAAYGSAAAMTLAATAVALLALADTPPGLVAR